MERRETRYRLTDRQFQAVNEAQQRVAVAKMAYDAALMHANVVSDLVLDAHKVPKGGRPESVDPETKDLVIVEEVEESPPQPSKTASEKK